MHLASLMQPLSSCREYRYEIPHTTARFRPCAGGGGGPHPGAGCTAARLGSAGGAGATCVTAPQMAQRMQGAPCGSCSGVRHPEQSISIIILPADLVAALPVSAGVGDATRGDGSTARWIGWFRVVWWWWVRSARGSSSCPLAPRRAHGPSLRVFFFSFLSKDDDRVAPCHGIRCRFDPAVDSVISERFSAQEAFVQLSPRTIANWHLHPCVHLLALKHLCEGGGRGDPSVSPW